MSAGCPIGGSRCPESICDCFAYQFPDNPEEWDKLHPELFEVLPPMNLPNRSAEERRTP